MDELTREFLTESGEGLGRMREALGRLKGPMAAEAVGEIFRVVHTIKGASGFLGLDAMEGMAHEAEHLLGMLREKQCPVSPVVEAILWRLLGALQGSLRAIELRGASLVVDPVCLGVERRRRRRVRGVAAGKVPVERLFRGTARMVNELARRCGKRVAFEFHAEEIWMDRTMLEALKAPLVHALRNAVDHGIESEAERLDAGKPVAGTIWLRAFEEAGWVVVEVRDDGAGVSIKRVMERAVAQGLVAGDELMSREEALELLFEPGFSTREEVTMISGRGVGMDVVRTDVMRAGGCVELRSVEGEGTTLRLCVPRLERVDIGVAA